LCDRLDVEEDAEEDVEKEDTDARLSDEAVRCRRGTDGAFLFGTGGGAGDANVGASARRMLVIINTITKLGRVSRAI